MFLLSDLYPHISLINSSDIRQKSVDLIQPLYENRNNLSVEVTCALIDCMGTLTKVFKMRCFFY